MYRISPFVADLKYKLLQKLFSRILVGVNDLIIISLHVNTPLMTKSTTFFGGCSSEIIRKPSFQSLL